MKKFFAVIFYALGVIGGLGWTLSNHAWVIAAGIVGLAVLAFPEMKRILSEDE